MPDVSEDYRIFVDDSTKPTINKQKILIGDVPGWSAEEKAKNQRKEQNPSPNNYVTAQNLALVPIKPKESTEEKNQENTDLKVVPQKNLKELVAIFSSRLQSLEDHIKSHMKQSKTITDSMRLFMETMTKKDSSQNSKTIDSIASQLSELKAELEEKLNLVNQKVKAGTKEGVKKFLSNIFHEIGAEGTVRFGETTLVPVLASALTSLTLNAQAAPNIEEPKPQAAGKQEMIINDYKPKTFAYNNQTKIQP